MGQGEKRTIIAARRALFQGSGAKPETEQFAVHTLRGKVTHALHQLGAEHVNQLDIDGALVEYTATFVRGASDLALYELEQ